MALKTYPDHIKIMKKTILIYVATAVLLLWISALFIIPEFQNFKKILKYSLTGILLYISIYSILKFKIFEKCLFITAFFVCLGASYVLEPTNGFLFESKKIYISKLNNFYLYRNRSMIDDYLLLYEKDMKLPLLNFRGSRERTVSDNEQIQLVEIKGKVYIKIGSSLSYIIEPEDNYQAIQDYKTE